MLTDVIRGKEKKPRRILLYGTHGIGKSTWAAQAPNPIFIPTEDGLGEIDCAKFPILDSHNQVMIALSELYGDKHDYRTVVVDSVDWLERMIWDEVCEGEGVKAIDEIGYGKGYGIALKKWTEFVAALSDVRAKRNMMVVLVSHSKIERYENPETDSYDRYSPRLHKSAAHLLQEWADEVLFATYTVNTRTTGEGVRKRHKGIGGDNRVLRTTERPAHLAKNRLNLPEELPLIYTEYEKFFTDNETPTKGKKKEAANG